MCKTIKANENDLFLNQILKQIPSNCLFNKGVTGCGGTTLEIESNRNSIILVPNVNLVLNKCNSYPNLIGVYGAIDRFKFNIKFKKKEQYKKIIATYDALPKLIEWIGDDIFNYFLLIDEYHILFNSYGFRYKAITYILQNYNKFNEFCFMTATPLKDYNVLEELKHLEQVIVEWPNATPVSTELRSVYFTSKEVAKEINNSLSQDYNLHIFINSLNTIRSIIKIINTSDFRTICSKDAEKKDKKEGKLKIDSVNSPVRKINFYTATAFEGVDIYDPVGKTIVVSDTNVSQSLVDISTLFIQICGRLRDSKYKNEVLFICNTTDHRYLKHKSQNEFDQYSEDLKEKAIDYGIEFLKGNQNKRLIDVESFLYSPDFFRSKYIGLNDPILDYDPNLKKIDYQNYNIITKVFNNTINVLDNLKACNVKVKTKINPIFTEIYNTIPELILSSNDVEKIVFPIIENRFGFCDWNIFHKIMKNYVSKVRRTLDNSRSYAIDFSNLKNLL